MPTLAAISQRQQISRAVFQIPVRSYDRDGTTSWTIHHSQNDTIHHSQNDRAESAFQDGEQRPVPVQRVFIGSCTNARIEDLRSVAAVVKGNKVASSVRAMIVPGSGEVRRQAEAEGLVELFLEAGFEWRQPVLAHAVQVPGRRASGSARPSAQTGCDADRPEHDDGLSSSRARLCAARSVTAASHRHPYPGDLAQQCLERHRCEWQLPVATGPH